MGSLETSSSLSRLDLPLSYKAPDSGSLDELTVKLVFEVGRCDTTLGELRTMAPGHVFALARDPEQAVDIVTGGRRVGTGELVKIGERLGVRVLRLSKDG